MAALAVAASVWQASLEVIEIEICAHEIASEVAGAAISAVLVQEAQRQAASELVARALLRGVCAAVVATELVEQAVSVAVTEAVAAVAAKAAERARAKGAIVAPQHVELREAIEGSRGKRRQKSAGWRRLFCCSSAPEEPEE